MLLDGTIVHDQGREIEDMLFKIIVIVGVIWIIVSYFQKEKTRNTSLLDEVEPYMIYPRIHYQRLEYLKPICSQKLAASKIKLEILIDFATCTDDNKRLFLLRDQDGKLYLRWYARKENPDGVDRYIINDVSKKVAKELASDANGVLNKFCREKFGKSATDVDINCEDTATNKNKQGVKINRHRASFASWVISEGEAEQKMETWEPKEPDYGDIESDMVEMGVYNNGPDEAELAWRECERQLNYSLYVTHDWDIFNDEK